MDTYFYSAAAIVALIASAFLFAFYEEIRSNWRFKMKKATRVIRHIDREDGTSDIILETPSYTEELTPKEKTACNADTKTIIM